MKKVAASAMLVDLVSASFADLRGLKDPGGLFFGDDHADSDGRLCLHGMRLFRNLYRRPGQAERGGAEVGESALAGAMREGLLVKMGSTWI